MTNELLAYCQETTGLDRQTIEKVLDSCLEYIVRELAQGHTVDLGDDFGVFSAKLWESNLAESSPRAPEDARYKAVFRESSRVKQRLKVSRHG